MYDNVCSVDSAVIPCTTAGTSTGTALRFTPVTAADLPLINGLLQTAISRTCDYSIGGIFMWVDYFGYEYCVYDDTLFIKGRTENNRSETAFMLPVGALPLQEAIHLILDYCAAKGLQPVFSAVPQDRLDALLDVLHHHADIEELADWSDYLYDIASMATFAGKHLAKKRNHINQFIAANPHYLLEPLSCELLPEASLYLCGHGSDHAEADPMAAYEHAQCRQVLNHYSSYPFEGAVLRDESGAICAFAVGEVVGDTLFVHIEKMNHDTPGAGAAIAKLFASYMLSRHRSLRFVNREEDCGDPGLRNAKMQYHPAMILHKFNVRA